MAITLTSLLGTNSISSDRITINNNFSAVGNATNLLIQIVNISTGAIDNSTFGAAPTIRTIGLTANTISANTITASGNIVGGNLISSAYVRCAEDSYFGFGTDAGFNLSKVFRGGDGDLYILDASGAIGGAGGDVGYIRLPFYDNATTESIPTPDEGSIYYETNNQNIRIYIGQDSNGNPNSPSWQTISTQEWVTTWVQNYIDSLSLATQQWVSDNYQPL